MALTGPRNHTGEHARYGRSARAVQTGVTPGTDRETT